MKNKEIIIDGVNVAGCCYAEPTPTTPKCSINEYIHCDGHNCYYKQLQHKSQECEELKKYKDVVNKLAGMQIILTNKDKMPELYENAKDLRIDRYKQALDKIEKILTNTYCLTNFTCKETAEMAKKLLTILNEVKDAKN